MMTRLNLRWLAMALCAFACISLCGSRSAWAQDEASSDDESQTRIVVSPQLQRLREIEEQMRTIATQLEQADTSANVQRLQLDILGKIDQMLADSDPQGADTPSSGTQAAQSGTQAEDASATDEQETGSGETEGEGLPGQAADTPPTRDLIEATWGKLPARLQEQMRAALSTDFLPKYEKLVEGYYKRLAEADLDGS